MQEQICRCADCLYWEHGDATEGLCRRHAPAASQRMDEVGHWPETRATDGCAEGARGPGAPVQCMLCVYWSQPSGGLDPERRHDQPLAWWHHAGHCHRRAPLPTPEPGARGFWRATAAQDACGDGEARASA